MQVLLGLLFPRLHRCIIITIGELLVSLSRQRSTGGIETRIIIVISVRIKQCESDWMDGICMRTDNVITVREESNQH